MFGWPVTTFQKGGAVSATAETPAILAKDIPCVEPSPDSLHSHTTRCLYRLEIHTYRGERERGIQEVVYSNVP